YPLQKCARIAGIAQGSRCHHLHRIRAAFLRGTMEAPQHAHRFRHCLGRKQSATEDAFTQPGDFAVFVDFFQPPGLQARNFQTNGIRANVDGGNGGHGGDDVDDQYSHKGGGWRKLMMRIWWRDGRLARQAAWGRGGVTPGSPPFFNRFVTTLWYPQHGMSNQALPRPRFNAPEPERGSKADLKI